MKSMIIAIIAFALIIAFGVVEVSLLCSSYDDFNKEIKMLMEGAQEKTLTVERMDYLAHQWIKLREKAEIFVPNSDLAECNNRVFECRAYVAVGDFDNAYVQLSLLDELTKYHCHLLRPIFSHIV